jgi:hypothetical protein
VDLTVDAMLRRAGGVAAPEVLVSGSWFTIRGVFPVGAIAEATLGGRSLRLGRLTPRELTFFVESAQPVGLQTLQVHVGGLAVVTRDVLVQ